FLAGSFFNLQDLVAPHISESLSYFARPANFYALSQGFSCQTKMHAFVAACKIASRCSYGCKLCPFRGHDFDFCADCIFVALVPNEFQHHAVILGGIHETVPVLLAS